MNKVFLVGGFETTSGKTQVSFGKNLNLPENNRLFNKLSTAKKFAKAKAKKFGLESYTEDLPSGTKEIKI